MSVTPKPIHPLKFFSRLRWLDSKPLVILPYRQKIFTDVLFTFDEMGQLSYTLALLLRAKKNDKSLDGMLAQLYGLCAWRPVGGYTGRIVAFDQGQADEDLDLFKKLVKANPVLLDALSIKQRSVERKDGRGFVEIIPGRDVQGQRGGKFDLPVLVVRDAKEASSELPPLISTNAVYEMPGCGGRTLTPRSMASAIFSAE